MHLNTIDNLRKYIKRITKKDPTDVQLIWMVSFYEAEMYFDSGSVRELADLFVSGCAAKTISDVEEWLNVMFEEAWDDDPESYKQANGTVMKYANRFFAR